MVIPGLPWENQVLGASRGVSSFPQFFPQHVNPLRLGPKNQYFLDFFSGEHSGRWTRKGHARGAFFGGLFLAGSGSARLGCVVSGGE